MLPWLGLAMVTVAHLPHLEIHDLLSFNGCHIVDPVLQSFNVGLMNHGSTQMSSSYKRGSRGSLCHDKVSDLMGNI